MLNYPTHTIRLGARELEPWLEQLQQAFGVTLNIAAAIANSPKLINSLVGPYEEAGWLSDHWYPPRWITRHKPGGDGGILQGRSWHGDLRGERA